MFNNEQQENPISDIDYGVIQDQNGNTVAIEVDPANAKYKILQYLALLKAHIKDGVSFDENQLSNLIGHYKIKDNAPKYSDYSGSSDDFGYDHRMRENDILVYLKTRFNLVINDKKADSLIPDINHRDCKVKSLFVKTITQDNNGNINVVVANEIKDDVDKIIKYLKNTLYTNDPFVQKILSDLETKDANYATEVLEALQNVANTQKELHSDKFCDIEYVNIKDDNNNKVNTPVHIDFNNNNFFSNLGFTRIESNEIEEITDAYIKFKKGNKQYCFLREVGAIIQSNVVIPTDTDNEDYINDINKQDKNEFKVFFNNHWHTAQATRREKINDFINVPDAKQVTNGTKNDVLIVVDDNFTGERNIIDFKSNGVMSIKDKHKQTFETLTKYAKDGIKYLTGLSEEIKKEIEAASNTNDTKKLENIFCWDSERNKLSEDSQPHQKLEAIYDLFDNLDDKSTGIKDTLEYKFIKKYLELLKNTAKYLHESSLILKNRPDRKDNKINVKKEINFNNNYFKGFMDLLDHFLDIIKTGNLSKINDEKFVYAYVQIKDLQETYGISEYDRNEYTRFFEAIKSTAYDIANKEKLDISIKHWDKSEKDGTLQEKKNKFKSNTIDLFGGEVAQGFKLKALDKVYDSNSQDYNDKTELLKSVLEEFDNSNVVEENDLAEDYKAEKEAQKQEEEERKKQEEYEKTPQGKKEIKKRKKEEAKREKEMQKIAEENIKNQAKQQIDKALNDLQNIQEYKWWMAIVNFFNDIFGLKTHYKTDNENKSIYSNALAMLKNLPISLDQSAITSINNELQEAYNKIADNNMDRCYQLEYKGINNGVKNSLKNAKKTEKSIS